LSRNFFFNKYFSPLLREMLGVRSYCYFLLLITITITKTVIVINNNNKKLLLLLITITKKRLLLLLVTITKKISDHFWSLFLKISREISRPMMREDSENIVHWSGVENLMNRVDLEYFLKKKVICY
jgi:hypothetical protein